MKKYLRLIYLTPLVALAACACMQVQEEKMLKLASQLTKLTAAVESTVRYKNPPENLSDEKLLETATQIDPQLLGNFADYHIKISRANKHATLLVCTKDSKQALLADGGCTAKMDLYLWNREPTVACEIREEIKKVCEK